ncbi:MAG: DUF3134 family protein [Cyanobacteria bacterium J06648_1]
MIKKPINPALQEELIVKPALIITPRENESLFRWIKSTGRFMPSHSERFHDDMMTKANELENILDQEEESDEEE